MFSWYTHANKFCSIVSISDENMSQRWKYARLVMWVAMKTSAMAAVPTPA
jgi:hypothetical protein